MRMQAWVGGLAVGLSMAGAAAAAEPGKERFMLFGGADFGQFGDDEGSLGEGGGLLMGGEYKPWERVGIEGYVSHFKHHRDNGDGVRFKGTGRLVGVNVVYHFRGQSVRPYLLGGIGILRSERQSRFPLHDGPLGEDVFRIHETGRATQIGAGLDVRLHPLLALRPEVRMLVGREAVNRVSASVALALHF